MLNFLYHTQIMKINCLNDLFIGNKITAGTLTLPESAPSNDSDPVVAEETPTNDINSPQGMSNCLLKFDCVCN